MEPDNPLHPQTDSPYGFELESEIKAKEQPLEELPSGMRYVADTRKQSIHPDQLSQAELETTRCNIRKRGYLPIENYGIIGNMRTIALCGTDGSIDFYCYPKFDSPSLFCRAMDKEKGGHFAIFPSQPYTSNKQMYLPNSNILMTRFMSDDGVAEIIDYMHVPSQHQSSITKPLLPWMIRTVRVIRTSMEFKLECYPAFNYALDEHTTHIVTEAVSDDQATAASIEAHLYPDRSSNYYTGRDRVVFKSKGLTMDLRHLVRCGDFACPVIKTKIDYPDTHKGPGVMAEFELQEGQEVTFVLREVPSRVKPNDEAPSDRKIRLAHDPPFTMSLLDALFRQTNTYWMEWVTQSTYKGRWREHVLRSALTLKLLTYQPTGAVVASPTFGFPEAVLGFTVEAGQYMKYIAERCNELNEDGSLNIMYSIDGVKRLDERELSHLDGYRSSKPIRIGNGAYDHLQLDIYGELLDGIYLYNKYGSPISYDMWCAVRKLADYVCVNWNQPDMSIWEVRGKKQHFTFSLIMCWVALDRDEIYELVQNKCYNHELKMFTQSVESPDALDASVLIMPLVFFSSPTDPRLLNTLNRILLPPEKGGLVANDLVFRYNFLTTDDGVGGLEGAFSMCTFWLVEALTRAGQYDKKLLIRAEVMFEKMLTYGNHLGLFSEEVARSGEMLGNFPQAFTHLSFISAAYNLDRVLSSS
ncbi:Six-hairpin glycosidase-like protein [Pilobolus umbonatus]|nr:Six-hairpin glycosidase-like protein [Pilobolus umbonatus]